MYHSKKKFHLVKWSKYKYTAPNINSSSNLHFKSACNKDSKSNVYIGLIRLIQQ